MRAFRPSYFAHIDEETREELMESVRMVNVRLYQKRAQAGLPLFDTFRHVPEAQGGSSAFMIPTDH